MFLHDEIVGWSQLECILGVIITTNTNHASKLPSVYLRQIKCLESENNV